MEQKRLFAGIAPDLHIAKAAEILQAQHSELSAIRFVPSENLHLTLAFLGNRPVQEIPDIIERAETIFSLHLPIWLNKPVYRIMQHSDGSGMIWLQFEPRDCFTRLCMITAKHLGNSHPDKAPLPHVTLARFQHLPSEYALPKVHLDFEFCAKQLVVYESLLTKQGAQYVPLATFQ